MKATRDKLRTARAKLKPLVKKRGPTTEAELDECVQVLEEVRRACGVTANASITSHPDIVGFLSVIQASLNVVAERIKNRPKVLGASKP